MKNRSNPYLRNCILATSIALTISLNAYAASANWNVDADGTWSTAANWSSDPIVPGTAAGDVIGLNFDITAAGKTVTIDTAVRIGTLNIGDPNGSNSYTLALSSGSLTFDNGASAAQINQVSTTNNASISAPLALDSELTINNSSSGNLNLDGNITDGVNGAKAVTVNSSGTGPAIFNSAKTYTGGTILTAGTARIGNNACFGTGTLTLNGGTLAPSGATARTLANSIVIGGNLAIGDATGTAKINTSGTVDLGGAVRELSLASDLQFDGIVSNGGLSKTGAGILTLRGVNTFSSGVTIKQGTVSGATSSVAFGTGSILLGDTSGTANAMLRGDNRSFANPIVVQSGSTANTLTIQGTGGGGTTTFSGGVTLNRSLTLDSLGGTLTFSTVALTGAGTLTIINSAATPILRTHRVVLNVPSLTYSSALDVLAGGCLRVSNINAVNATNVVKIRSGGLFEVNITGPTIGGLNDDGVSGGVVSLTGGNRTLILGGSGIYSFNGSIENYTETVVVVTPPSSTPTLRVLSLTKSGTGTQSLAGTNTYTGTTTVNGGDLKLDSANALPGGIGVTGGTSALLFNSGGVIGLTAASGDFTRAILGISPGPNQVGWAANGQGGFAAFGGDRLVNFGGAADPIIWNQAGGVFGTNFILSDATADSKVTVVNPISFNGGSRTVTVHNGSAAVDAVLGGVLSSGGTLIKDGLGTLELTAANTYGAATNVLAGTLRVSGAHSGAGTVTVSSGATLETSGQLSFAPTLNGTSNKITGAGTANLNGTLRFNLTGTAIANGNSWTIVDAATVNSNLAGIASNPSLTWNESPSGVWKAVDGSNTWTYSEPSGTLSLAVSTGVSYESWAITNGIGGAPFTDDNDNDGLDNGTEYGIGSIPTAFTAQSPLVKVGPNYTLTYAKGAEAAADPQIDYLFEISTSLSAWTEVSPTTENASSVSYTLVGGPSTQFVRLKIKRLP